MQLTEEKREMGRTKSRGRISPLLTSFSRPDQPGTIAVVKAMPVKFEKKRPVLKSPDYSDWNMPVQENGVIKCRDHDFW